MVKKVVDSRIPTLINNSVISNHRSFFVIVGDHGRDQVVNLHVMLTNARLTSRPSVLWCYKKELGFSSHKKKRMKKMKHLIAKGLKDAENDDPFDLFISATNIRYCFYKETHKVLGNTYGMCVLQDFEALTPNLLARTIETVEGGGIVVLLLKSMTSLRQLYTMTMDVHARYRTESHQDVVNRFNERFILSLSGCNSCLVVDDELNVLPISMGKNVKPLPPSKKQESTPEDKQLVDLKESLVDTQPVGSIANIAKTLDQAKALLTFVDAIAEKTLKSTVSLTAARGRGKSAAMGLAIAAAVAYGYSNIFVTSPDPSNLRTLFQFVFKGFDALGYEEHMDYDILQATHQHFQTGEEGRHKSTDDSKGAVVIRVNIFKNHRQTIQYIDPRDSHVLTHAELLIIDEAAAIPLPLVKKLLGPYLVFMSSTINGYEGTGRSLSLKLLQQLREQSSNSISKSEDSTLITTKETASNISKSAIGRQLKEIKLETPIRYGSKDDVESWLNQLLCLDATVVERRDAGCPDPKACELYYVNRDTLFSFHPASELFLQRMMALYVASHYKNTPNDLQLLSDAPAHHLFVLLPPINKENTSFVLPEPLCVIQVCLEGQISRQSVLNSLSRGQRSSGDMIPWCISQQFQDNDFAGLSGCRIVRIATHPDYMSMGYGARAIELLQHFYEGKFSNILSEEDDDSEVEGLNCITEEELKKTDLKSESVSVREAKSMPPLLLRLSEKKAPKLHWLGVSFGLTTALHKFWKRSGFLPLYVRQTANELTGEHTCVMMKALDQVETGYSKDWLKIFVKDFKRRFISLLSFQFKDFPSLLSLSLLDMKVDADVQDSSSQLQEPNTPYELVMSSFTPYDLKRLESYANNMVDYHLIMDLLPTIASQYFQGKLQHNNEGLQADKENISANNDDLRKVSLTGVQALILIGLGLQRKTIDDMEKEINLPTSQLLALFTRIIRKITQFYKNALERHETEEFEASRQGQKQEVKEHNKRDVEDDERWVPLETAMHTAKDVMDEELEEAGDEALQQMREKQRELIQSLDLSKYAIKGSDSDWNSIETSVGSKGNPNKNAFVSVSSGSNGKRGVEDHEGNENKKMKLKQKSRPSVVSQVMQEAKKHSSLSNWKKKGGKRSVKK